MRRVLEFAKRCGRWALPAGASLSAILFLCVADACVCFRGGQCSYSFTDRLHVLVDAGGPSGIAKAIICNSDLLVAAQYAEFTKESGNPLNGVSYSGPGFHYWQVSYNGSRTYWFVAVSLWYAIALTSALPVLWLGRRLWRRRFRFSLRSLLIFALAVALFFGAWSLTASLGTRDVTKHLDDLLSVDGRSPHVDRDPLRDDHPRGDEEIPQCHYVGNAASPFPCVVTVDYGYIVYVRLTDLRFGYPEDGHFHGESGRACFFWFLGYTHELRHWSRPRRVMIGGD